MFVKANPRKLKLKRVSEYVDGVNYIQEGGKKQPGGGKKKFPRYARNLAPAWLKSCVLACPP